VNESAGDILTRLEGKACAEAESAMREVTAFLRDTLRGGPQLASEVVSKAETLGISESALRRALKKLGGSSQKLGFGGGWVWELPWQVA
jgi:hypothetical protein